MLIQISPHVTSTMQAGWMKGAGDVRSWCQQPYPTFALTVSKNGRIWPRSSRATVVIRIVDKKFVPKNLTILNMFLRTRASQADCALLIITAHCMCWTRLDITLRICAYVNVTICKYAWVPMCRERGAYAFTLPCMCVYLRQRGLAIASTPQK